jgi:hypothetical protein
MSNGAQRPSSATIDVWNRLEVATQQVVGERSW